MMFDEQLTSLYPKAKLFARSLTKDDSHADTVLHMACEKVLKNKDKFEKGTNFKAWFYRIIKNEFLNSVRDRKKHDKILASLNMADRYSVMEEPISVHTLKIIEKMEKKQIAALLLVYLEDFTYEEAAKILNLNKGRMPSWIHRAKNSFKEKWGER